MTEEVPEDVKFVVQLMGAMHNDTLDATDGVMRNLTIQGRQNEARYELLMEAIMTAMSDDYILSQAVVINRCFEAVAGHRVNQWLLEW